MHSGCFGRLVIDLYYLLGNPTNKCLISLYVQIGRSVLTQISQMITVKDVVDKFDIR